MCSPLAIMSAMSRWSASTLAVLFLACGGVACGGNLGGPSGDEPDGGDRFLDSGAVGLIDYDPSNIDQSHISVGLALIAIANDVTINTETGEIVGLAGGLPSESIFVVVPQADLAAPPVAVFSWASLTIEDGVTVTVEGPNAIIFALSENATINGTINASATGLIAGLAGPGGFAGGNDITPTGGGLGGGTSVAGRDGGGGGGSHGGLGGNGGLQEGSTSGVATLVVGTTENVPLFGGSGGGRGGRAVGSGLGGGGGGAVQISARGELRVGANAAINVSGAAGVGGTNDYGGGGGGAAGAILLEGRAVLVDGTMAANGGGGGAGANQNNQGLDGTHGGGGATPSPGGVGNGEGTSGGPGASVDSMVGGPGIAGLGNTGGGGGGSGRIYFRSREAAIMTGIVSPTMALAVGTL